MEVRNRATALGRRIGKRCDAPFRSPETVEMSQLCTPPASDRSSWDQMMGAGHDLVTQSSDRRSASVYRRPADGSEPIGEAERLCRQTLGDFLRMAFRGRVRQRTECFRQNDKNGDGAYNCMATVAWPGRVEPVGFERADRALTRALTDLKNAIGTFCSTGIENMRFSDNARITDPTASTPGGEAFTTEDLYHVLADEILREETNVITDDVPGPRVLRRRRYRRLARRAVRRRQPNELRRLRPRLHD